MSKDTGMAPGGVPRDVILEQTPRGKSRDKWVSRGMKRDPYKSQGTTDTSQKTQGSFKKIIKRILGEPGPEIGTI